MRQQGKLISPAAQQVLDQLTAAHQALFSYSAQVKVEAISDARNETTTAILVYMKPGKARIEARLPGGKRTTLSVCDGTARLVVAGTTRRRAKAEPGEKALIETLVQANLFIAPVFLYLTSRSAAVRTILPGAAKVLGFGPALVLDGVEVDVVVADVETAEGKARLVFSVGKEDRLLRRLEVNTTYQKQSLSLVETYTEVRANPKLDSKVFRLAS
jgi:outer membrane lipoprotein-sorting protein